MDLVSGTVVGNGNNLRVQHGTDAGLYVQFYMEAIKDEESSEKQGRQIFVDREFIKIIPVGDKNTVVCRPVNLKDDGVMPPDNVRWPSQYAAFKNQQIQVNEGTPVEELPWLSKSQAMMFKSVNVHTVEQLAAVSDTNLSNLGMGARELREKAVNFIANANGGAGVGKLEKENKELRIELEAMKNQMAALIDAAKKSDKKD